MLRLHYEKLLYPYDIFLSGAMTGTGDPQAMVSPFSFHLSASSFTDSVHLTIALFLPCGQFGPNARVRICRDSNEFCGN